MSIFDDPRAGNLAPDMDLGKKKLLEGKVDWRQIPAIHEWLDNRGMAPNAEAHLKIMAAWGKMNVWDAEVFRKAMEMPFAGPSMRWVASIPASVMALMLEANPNILSSKEEFHKWLRDTSPTGGAKYRVPGSKL